MREGTAVAIRREDYTAPAFWIRTVDLSFDLEPAKTLVINRMQVERNPALPAQPLRLHGEDITLTRVLVNVRVQSPEQITEAAEQMEARAEQIANVTYTAPTETGEVESFRDPATTVAEVPRVGRNDPCPCGSGKKYKSCHGKLA